MHYQYSTVVDPSTYETEGLCEGIPLRVHHNPELEDVGAIEAQEHWREHVGPLEPYKGGLGPEYSFMSVAVPECIPERMRIISYANEFAFLHDDITDIVDHTEGEQANNEMLDAFRQGAENGSIQARGSGKRHIQSKLLLDMLSIDRKRALKTMEVWAEFVRTASGRQHHTEFKGLEEYLEYRTLDVGQMQVFWFGMMTFGMAITIPDEETEICKQLCRPAWVTAGLTNDLYSWDKEHRAAMETGQEGVVNALWVLMKEHSISLDEAKALCRKLIKENVARYVQIVKETKDRKDLSPDLRRYVEALQYSLSGNVVWSLRCPRYHTEYNYNPQQLDWMKNGVPKSYLKRTNGSSDCNGTHTSNTINGFKRKSEDQHGMPNGRSGSPKKSKPVANGHTNTNGSNGFTNGVNGHANGVNGQQKRRDSLFDNEHEDLGIDDVLLDPHLPGLSDGVILAPSNYLQSLPSKGVRDKAIDALNVWLAVPDQHLRVIKTVIGTLHSASLMLDDLEDGSALRRSKPSTHTVFGGPQTVNSATYQIMLALDDVRKLDNPDCERIFSEEMKNLYIGQSLDLHWTSNLICPTVGEYLKMIDNKTGGLFRMLSRLMLVKSASPTPLDVTDLTTLLGRYFQIRDDYQNLASADYAKQKGFCEDLDEGKFSLPLIHAVRMEQQESDQDYRGAHSDTGSGLILRNTLMQRRTLGHSTAEHKQLVLEHMRRVGSLEYTVRALRRLQGAIEREVDDLERVAGMPNPQMRLLISLLQV